jgi:transcriptional regulator with XRE-family HTH domain
MAKHLAKQAKAKRLALNLSQQSLAERSGVSYGSLKKFEQSGQISLGSLLKIALTLNSLDPFKNLFAPDEFEQFSSLDALLNEHERKRGRQ